MKTNYTTEAAFIPLVEDHHQKLIDRHNKRAIEAEARKSAKLAAEQKKRKRKSIIAEGLLASVFSAAIGISALVVLAFGWLNCVVAIILGIVFLIVSGFTAGSAYERSMNV